MTYAQLKADIADWLAAGDITATIPTLVRLAEDDIADDLRVRDMIRRARAPGNETRYLGLPERYLEMRRLEYWPESDRHYSLTQVTPENLQVLNVRDTSTASYQHPQRYSVHREIEFDAPVGLTGELEMIYYERYPALEFDTDTNWVLENSYALLLYGSLLHAEPYLRNDPRVPLWASAYQKALQTTMGAELRGRVNQADARVTVSGMTP